MTFLNKHIGIGLMLQCFNTYLRGAIKIKQPVDMFMLQHKSSQMLTELCEHIT